MRGLLRKFAKTSISRHSTVIEIPPLPLDDTLMDDLLNKSLP